MGEINFITKDSESDIAKDRKSATGNERPSKFTPSNPEDGEKRGPVFGMKKDDGGGDDKERIEKSRKEVLEMIDKNKKGPKGKSGGDSVSEKPKSWLMRFFSGGDKAIETDQKKKTETPNSQSVPADSAGASSIPKTDSPMIFNNNTWNNVGVLETNLIDKTDYSFFDTGKKIRALSTGVFASLALVMGLYLGLLFWENMKLEALKAEKEEILALETQVKKLEKETSEAKQFQEKLDVAVKILDKHVYMTNFLKILESKTLPNVYYVNSLAVKSNGIYSLTARTDDYESVKNQLMIFAEIEAIKNLKLSEISNYEENVIDEDGLTLMMPDPAYMNVSSTTPQIPVTKTGVEFGFDFEIDVDVFYKANKPEGEAEQTIEDSSPENTNQ